MGDAHRLGRRGVALGAAIAVTFGFGGGLLAVRWREAEAVQPAPPARDGLLDRAIASIREEPVAEATPTPLPPSPTPSAPPLRRTCGAYGGRLIRYRVRVEAGLATTVREVARGVSDVLCNPKGWTAGGRIRFRYDPRGPVLIRVASPAETERRCLALVGLSVRRTWSCASRPAAEVVLNADRWFGASPSWPGGVARYRRMLVNHEVGHILGHGHWGCPRSGAPAPVMMQQSKGRGGCVPNPWPTAAELAATR